MILNEKEKGGKMKYCPNCGAELRAEAKFCPACGFNLEQGTPNEDDNNEPFVQVQPKDHFELELEKAEGLNVTRAAYVRFFTNSILGLVSPYGYYNYNYDYSYGYSRPFSGVSTFLWFLVMIAALILILLIAALSTAVLQWCAIHTLRGNRADGLQIFAYFIKAQKNRVLKANVLMAIYTFFWSLLFVIPGIVKSASYAMTNYLLEKDDTLSASDAILLSRQIMDGYKMEFLILRYSFFFWNLIAFFQVTNFYIMPYQNVTEIQFLDMLYNHYVEKHSEA